MEAVNGGHEGNAAVLDAGETPKNCGPIVVPFPEICGWLRRQIGRLRAGSTRAMQWN
jgi:hypothetical protein